MGPMMLRPPINTAATISTKKSDSTTPSRIAFA
jgi:hypothetical protein